ncbi:MAG TPA: aspartyl protease family protein [Candidatus Sulfotelmatobacter sp.]|nr:aspartyl protease family protein [Candidatus Sulfotelmatobacter sp.]
MITTLAWITQQAKAPAPAPADPAAILSDARSLYQKGQFDSAIARYNEVLKADPASGDAYAGIVRSYLKQDKVQQADDTLQKALQVSPAYPDVKTAEGELLFRQGEIPEAGKLFVEVIAAPPDPAQPNAKPNARAYLGAARVAEASAMYAREHILITRAHAIDDSDPDIRKLWIDTLSTTDRIQSLSDYLSHPGNDDEDTQHRVRERLNFLKASIAAQASRCQPANDVTSTKTTFLPVSLGTGALGSGIVVQINGKPSKLLLDTGSSGILLSSKLAGSLGLKPVSEIRMGGIGDKPDAIAHVSYADQVSVGEMEFHNCAVTVMDHVPRESDGIIGADVFSQFLIELDFPNSQFRLSPLPPRPGETAAKASLNTSHSDASEEQVANDPAGNGPHPLYEDRYLAPEMHSFVQIFRIGHMLLVPTTVNESSSKLFLLDTGAFDNTITPEAARETTKVHRAGRIDVRGVNGDVKKVYVAERVTVDFGHLRQELSNMVAIDMSHASRKAGTEISGTLGMGLLNVLKIRLDYRDALADFQYTKKPLRR